jgi:hypothetical protein
VLISADFLASDFIAENELPPLLKAAEAEGVKIVSVVLKPCAFSETEEISQFQSANDPRRPVVSLNEVDREQLWYDVARTVNVELTSATHEGQELGEEVVSGALLDRPSSPWSLNTGLLSGLFSEELQNAVALEQFLVYHYEHIDDLAYMPRATDVLGHFPTYEATVAQVGKALEEAGWEGDGELRLLWLPPFLGAGMEDTYGVGIWFIKQKNNGTSWLVSPVPLPFSRLLQQNS